MNGEEICRALDREAAAGADFKDIQELAVKLLHDSDPCFHWTGIYELFQDNVLRLGPFIGAPTDHVFIAVGRGVCGTAVAERRNVNIADVRRESNYLACSSETRSELVVLIRIGETIYAQLDIDSHDLDAFGPEQVQRVEQVAAWLALQYERQAARTVDG